MEFAKILANGLQTIASKAERLGVAEAAAVESKRSAEADMLASARRNLLAQRDAFQRVLSGLEGGSVTVREAQRQVAREAGAVHAANPVFRDSAVLRTLMRGGPDYARGLKRLGASQVFGPLIERQHGLLESARPEIERLVKAAGPDLAAKRYATPAVEALTGELGELYAAVSRRVLPSFDAASEEIMSKRPYGGGFFGPTDNPPELLARARQLLERISGGKHQPAVIDAPGDFSAFAAGGSTVLFHSGAFALPENELKGLAAHEVEHLNQRHQALVQLATAVNAWLERRNPAVRESLDLGLKKLHRANEYAADANAVRELQRGGQDPASFLKLLDRLEESSLPEALLDHPTAANRRAAVRRLLAKPSTPGY